jgi:hypothetical protein
VPRLARARDRRRAAGSSSSPSAAPALTALMGRGLRVGESRARDDLVHATGARLVATVSPVRRAARDRRGESRGALRRARRRSGAREGLGIGSEWARLRPTVRFLRPESARPDSPRVDGRARSSMSRGLASRESRN